MNARSERKIEFLNVDAIETHGRLRDLRDEGVEILAGSLEAVGLRTPISVRYYAERPASVRPGETDDALILMTGAHRLAAAKRLGWEKIECFVYYDGDEIDAQLWEIAENLHRAELTALERDEQVALWVKLSKLRQPDEVSVGGRGKTGGTSAAAKEIGVSEPDARRAVKVAGLSDEAKAAARDAGLDDNRSALLDAARHTSVSDQVAAIRERAAARHVPKVADRPLHDVEALERQVSTLMSAWNKASAEARQEFLARIDAPVFDRSAA
jgi:hypothetical protein